MPILIMWQWNCYVEFRLKKNGKYEKEEAFYIFQTANKFRSLAIRKQTSLNPNSGRIFDSTEGFNRIALEIFHFKLLFSL